LSVTDGVPQPLLMQHEDMISKVKARRVPLPDPAVRRAIRLAAEAIEQDLADVVGVSRPTISRYETGQREPRGETRRRYAEALEALRRV